MRVLRVLGRLALWLLVLVAGFAAAIFFVVLFSAEDSGRLVGAIALLAVALLVVGAAVWALRCTRRMWPERDDPARALAEARERLRAGEQFVLRPSRHRWAGLLVVSIALTAVCGLAFVDEPNVVMAVGALLFGAGIVIRWDICIWASLRCASRPRDCWRAVRSEAGAGAGTRSSTSACTTPTRSA